MKNVLKGVVWGLPRHTRVAPKHKSNKSRPEQIREKSEPRGIRFIWEMGNLVPKSWPATSMLGFQGLGFQGFRV